MGKDASKNRPAFLIGFVVFLTAALVGYFFVAKDRELEDRFQGKLCSVSPRVLELGECAEDHVTTATFTLKNLTNLPITVFNAETSCACASVESLPLVVEPGASVPLKVNILPPKGSSQYDQTVTYSVQRNEKIEKHAVRVTAIPRPALAKTFAPEADENAQDEAAPPESDDKNEDVDLRTELQEPQASSQSERP